MVGPHWEGGEIFTWDAIEKNLLEKHLAIRKAETCIKAHIAQIDV